MRKAALLLPMVVVLAACSQSADSEGAPSPDASDAAASSEAVDEPGFEMKPGLYAITSEGMILAKTRLNPDFSYIDLNRENVRVGGGIWEADGASFCFNPRGEDGEEREKRCWDNGQTGEDGSFTTTLSDGTEQYVIVPLSE